MIVKDKLSKIFQEIKETPIDYSNHQYRLVAFLLPIIEGEIWLGQRNTEPQKGLYGAIGGKNEVSLEDGLFDVPHIVHLPAFDHHSHEDYLTYTQGREMLSETAAREFCEEVFSHLKYPDDFSKEDLTHLLRIGFVGDILDSEPNVTNLCYFYLGKVNRKDFSLNHREIGDFRRLSLVPTEEIYPLTRIALVQVKHLNTLFYEGSGFLPFDENHFTPSVFNKPMYEFKEFRDTDMAGVLLEYMKRGIKMPDKVKGRAPITSIEEAMYMNLTPKEVIGNQSQIFSERLVD